MVADDWACSEGAGCVLPASGPLSRIGSGSVYPISTYIVGGDASSGSLSSVCAGRASAAHQLLMLATNAVI